MIVSIFKFFYTVKIYTRTYSNYKLCGLKKSVLTSEKWNEDIFEFLNLFKKNVLIWENLIEKRVSKV